MSEAPEPLTGEERTELLALYQVTTQDLAFFKSQQWAITNYALVALAAIAGVTQLERHPPLTCDVRVLLCIAAAVVGGAAAGFLAMLHGSIAERRNRLERVYARLSPAFNEARGNKSRVSAWAMLAPLLLVILVGSLLVCWVVLSAF